MNKARPISNIETPRKEWNGGGGSIGVTVMLIILNEPELISITSWRETSHFCWLWMVMMMNPVLMRRRFRSSSTISRRCCCTRSSLFFLKTNSTRIAKWLRSSRSISPKRCRSGVTVCTAASDQWISSSRVVVGTTSGLVLRSSNMLFGMKYIPEIRDAVRWRAKTFMFRVNWGSLFMIVFIDKACRRSS